jgi:hypothetical protein
MSGLLLAPSFGLPSKEIILHLNEELRRRSEYILYEARMLTGLAHELASGRLDPLLQRDMPVVKNACLEAFAVHARVLLDFLYDRKEKDDGIIAAEHAQRPATDEEGQALARFAGFGPVALSIFPDPVTGRYKDVAWQALGEELKALLSPEEYDSAKRTTFNAFYTSPTVIAAIHQAIVRLGVPGNALVLEPGCGTGNLMGQGREGMHYIGVELDRISGRIARALHPGQDIRIENFRDTKLPEDSIDAVIGNVPFADVKLDYRGQKLSLWSCAGKAARLPEVNFSVLLGSAGRALAAA